MKIKPHPSYFRFLTQAESPFFDEAWASELSALNDLTWINGLEKENGETYNRDPKNEDFPSYWNWPEEWKAAYERAEKSAREKTRQYLLSAEKHKLGDIEMFVLEDKEEVWLSTPLYNYGSPEKMDAVEPYDSAMTAAYIFLNEYQEWIKRHQPTWNAANILSSADPAPPAYSEEFEDFVEDYFDLHVDLMSQDQVSEARAAYKERFGK